MSAKHAKTTNNAVNKAVRNIFIIAIVFITALAAGVLTASRVFTIIGDDGYAVPASSGITQSLSTEEYDAISLVEVRAEDTVYKKALGYYVGEGRDAIDTSFPMYRNDGVGLRFLDENNWLITADVDVFQTFDGLYVSEGVTYNIDMSQADAERFIFLQLTNGLYMNVQHAVFENRLGKQDIPTNSIILFREDSISWYAFNNGSLGKNFESSVFDATLTIDGETYDLYKLMKALGLISEAIERGEGYKPDEDILDDAEQILKPNQKDENDDDADKPPVQGDLSGDRDDTTLPGQQGSQNNSDPDGNIPGSTDDTNPEQNAGEGSDPAQGEDGEGEGAGEEDDPDQGDISGERDDPDQGEDEDEDDNPPATDDDDQGDTTEGNQGGSDSASGEGAGEGMDDEGGSLDGGSGAGSTGGSGDTGSTGGYGSSGGSGAGSTGGGGAGGAGSSGGSGAGAGGSGAGGAGAGGSGAGAGGAGAGGAGGSGAGGSGSGEGASGEGGSGDGSTGGGSGAGGSGDSEDGESNDNENEGGEGEPVIPPYQEPVVTIKDFDPWCYALDFTLDVNDPSATITRGVKFAVYTKIKGSGETTTDAQGHTVYPSENYEGQSLTLRTSRTGSQEMNLSPMRPGQTVYVQYTYRYYTEEQEWKDVPVEDENGDPVLDENGDPVTEYKEVTVRKRVNFYSDLVEVTIPTVEECTVQPVKIDWETDFAAYEDALQLQGITMANTSEYDAEQAKTQPYDFAYFMLNSLPYANRMELTLTPEKGETVSMLVNSSTLNRAQKEPTLFRSSTPKLQSNMKYTYTVALKDRYGNEMPLVANGVESNQFSGTIYTQKHKPTVTITEVDNIMDALTLKIEVSDPDKALDVSEPLEFVMLSENQPVVLYGNWEDGSALGSESAQAISLTAPEGATTFDGASYEFTLTSLAFSRLFTAQVNATYHPQPDYETEEVLQPNTGVSLGSLAVFTASLSSGQVGFITSFSNVLDTSATINATMNSNTTLDILPLIDEFRICLRDPSGKVVQENTIRMVQDELKTQTYTHDNGYIVLDAGNDVRPKVQLFGGVEQDRGSVWDNFTIGKIDSTDEEGNPVEELSNPMQLQIHLPKDYLTNFTKYTLDIKAVVIKGSEEYVSDIYVNLTNTTFTTKKTIPIITYNDLFVASDVAQFVDLKILDPDATTQTGAITANLYYGTTLLSVQTFYADQTPDGSGDPIDLSFSGLIEGANYTVTFVANEYNDEEGHAAYRKNHTLATYNLVGGSDLTGSLNLTYLSGAMPSEENLLKDVTVYEKTIVTTDSPPKFYKHSSYATYIIPCEPYTTYEIEAIINYSSGIYFRYGSTSSSLSVIESYCTKDSANALILTTGGYKYFHGGNLPNHEGTINGRFTTGADDQYILFNCHGPVMKEVFESGKIFIRKYEQATDPNIYDADIEVKVNDIKGYLGRDLDEGETPSVTMTVEIADSMQEPVYAAYESFTLPLTENADGSLTADLTKSLTELPARKGYRATLTCEYKGIQIKLDEITFRTDNDYITVSTHLELYRAVQRNPYANILVTSDFETDADAAQLTLYGTIDFQGHVVTLTEEYYGERFIYQIQPSGAVRNLVFDFPNTPYFKPTINSIMYYNYGLMENIMIRTYGQIELDNNTEMIQAIGSNGVMRNFIYRLGGDVILNGSNPASNSVGLVCSLLYGTLENGYIYGVDGAGVLQIGAGKSGIFGYPIYSGHVENVYVLLDNWQPVDESGAPKGTNYYLSGQSTLTQNQFRNLYTVGEFYTIGTDSKKSYLLPLSSPKYVPGAADTAPSSMHNVWHIAATEGLTYVNPPLEGSIDLLRDVKWQESVLGGGGAFDIAGSVPMGFYPRLKLSAEMQKYQEYIPLPVQQPSNVPEILSDSWTEGMTPGLKEGTITLRLRNDSRSTITEVKIENLITTKVDQIITDDGLTELILSVQVDPNNEKYDSSYKVEEIEYVAGSMRRSIKSDYVTQNIAFWKEVRTAADWHAINSNMSWNYKLTADIDFADVVPGQIILNGKLDDIKNRSNYSFKGIIDGGEHVLKNIKLENIAYPYVIAYLLEGEVRNLFVDNLSISQSNNTIAGVGFIGQCTRSTVKNVRVRNSRIVGGYYVGGLVGYAYITNGIFENCSVTDTVLSDVDVSASLSIGGFVGYNAIYFTYENCYTRNVTINVSNSNAITGVGGFVGSGQSAGYYNCYTHGKITTNGNYVGGFNGHHNASSNGGTYNQIFTYVDILQTAGDNAGGFGGRQGTPYNLIVLGNVNGSGANTRRISGIMTSQVSSTCYAWEGQLVTGVAQNDKNNAAGLITDAELGRASTWQDTVRLGDHWDYSPVAEGYLPILAAEYDAKDPEWQQERIILPGQGTDPDLRVVSADFDDTHPEDYAFIATVRLNHPGTTKAQMEAYIESGNLSFTLDGMDLSDAAIADNQAEILYDSYGTEEQPAEERHTLIQIKTRSATRAYDSYRMTLTYNDGRPRELSTMISYYERDGALHVEWLEIPDINAWNYYMNPAEGNRGQTEENILITGDIDFGGTSTPYNGLKFNRLSGKGSTVTGFSKMRYSGGSAGGSWIDKIVVDFSGLYFKECVYDFTAATVSRTRTGVIQVTDKVSDLVLDQVSLSANRYTLSYFGFISYAAGDFNNITIKNCRLDGSGTGQSYAAILVAGCDSSFNNIYVENAYINAQRVSYVGAVVGTQNTYGLQHDNMHIKGMNITGYHYVGGIAGQMRGTVVHVTGEGVPETGYNTVKATYPGTGDSGYAGGLFGWYYGINSTSAPYTEVEVKNINVEGYRGVGAVAGIGYFFRWDGALIQNCNVKARDSSAGAAIGSYPNYTYNLYNTQIIGCTVESTGRAGGLCGSFHGSTSGTIDGLVIRDTSITSTGERAGGVLGQITATTTSAQRLYRIYIAEDVTVKGTENVGGIIGYAQDGDLQACFSGAKVEGSSNVGGLIGQADLHTVGTLRVKFLRCLTAGDVTASYDYAGGIIGRLNSPTLEYVEDTLKQCLVTGDVVGAGSKTSMWINDTATSGSAGLGTVYVYEEATLNGQKVKALQNANDALGQQGFIVPETTSGANLIVSASTLNTKAFYKDTLQYDQSFDYSNIGEEGNLYMPYTRNKEYTEILHYANHDADGNAAGIRLPVGADPQKEIVVYTTGVRTVNIEVPMAADATEGAAITVNGASYTTDVKGILTLNYNFDEDFTVGDTLSYTSKDLARRVMTHGEYWYYIDQNGAVHYGMATGSVQDMQERGTVDGLAEGAKAIHLWRGAMLDDSGNEYSLSGGRATNLTQPAEGGQGDAKPQNFSTTGLSTPLYADNTVQIFHNFSIVGSNTLPYRVYILNGTPYTVSADQDAVYDGVVLSAVGSTANQKRYFATLGNDGKLKAWLSNMQLGDAKNENIHHISNNFSYTGTVLMICYDDGNVIGVDYNTGMSVCNTKQTPGILAYAKRSFTSLFKGNSMPGGVLSPETDYAQGEDDKQKAEEIYNELKSSLANGDKLDLPGNPGDNGELSTDAPGDFADNGEELGNGEQSADEGGKPSDEQGSSNGDGEQAELVEGNEFDGKNDAADQTGNTEEGSGEGSDANPDDAQNTAQGDDTGDAADGEGDASDLSGNGSGGNADPDGTGSGGSAEGSGNAGNSSTTTTGESGENTAQTGGNDHSGGNNTQTGDADADGKSDANGEKTEEPAIDPESALLQLTGDSLLVYSAEIGAYVPMETNSIINGNPITLEKAIRKSEARKHTEQNKGDLDDNAADTDGKLDITHGIGRDLYTDEKQGFMFIGIAAAAVAIILGALYFAVIRKRKNK